MAFTTVTFAWDIVLRRNVPPFHSTLDRCQEDPSLFVQLLPLLPHYGLRTAVHVTYKSPQTLQLSANFPAGRHCALYSLTFRPAWWWCSRTPDSAGRKRWLRSMASHLPSGPDLGLPTPGCMDKQTERGSGKQTTASGLCTRAWHRHLWKWSLSQQQQRGGVICWDRNTHVSGCYSWKCLLAEHLLLCLHLLLLKPHNSRGHGFPDTQH